MIIEPKRQNLRDFFYLSNLTLSVSQPQIYLTYSIRLVFIA